MPRGNPRQIVNFMLNAQGVAWLDELALQKNTTRSLVIRACLAVAKRHEPELNMMLDEQKEHG